MSTDSDWVDTRITAAVAAVADPGRAFPDALIKEFQELLSDELQYPRRPAELEAIAVRLGLANRPAA